MPRILHIINRLALGGAEVMLLDIIRNSNHNEFDYHILTPYGEGELDNRAKSYGIELHPIQNGLAKGKLTTFNESVELIKKLKPDIINTHTRFSDLTGLIGGKRAGIPLRIMTVHAAGMYFMDSRPLHEGIIEYYVARHAVHYVAVSGAVVKYIVEQGKLPERKITLIHNGIDPDRIKPSNSISKSDARKAIGIEENDFLILAIGRLIREKGFDILIDSFASIAKKESDISLAIVGYGNEFNSLKEQVKKLRLEHKIKLTGRLDNIGDVFRAGDCFVLPSRQEGFGLAVLEAMSAGLPVIASNIGGVPDIIDDRISGLLFRSEDRDDLADTILMLKNDSELSDRLIENGTKSALSRFHIKTTAAKYENLYGKLIAGDFQK